MTMEFVSAEVRPQFPNCSDVPLVFYVGIRFKGQMLDRQIFPRMREFRLALIQEINDYAGEVLSQQRQDDGTEVLVFACIATQRIDEVVENPDKAAETGYVIFEEIKRLVDTRFS